jgi:DNA invertase Pin-like site-specific DNA recombinase
VANCTGDVVKLIGIVRVSTDGQAGKDGEGLERQRESIRKIALREGVADRDLVIIPIVGVSGSDVADAVEWDRDVVPRLADPETHLAADAQDRLIRADRFDFRVLQVIQATRTRVYLPGGCTDLAKPDDVLMSLILAGLAGKEKREMSRRSVEGREAHRKTGRWVAGRTTLGISCDRADPTAPASPSNPRNRWQYTADAEAVAALFHRFTVDREPTSAIATTLEQMQGKSRNPDRPVPRQALSAILTNPLYRGIVQYAEKRGEVTSRKAGGKQPNRKKVARSPDDVITVRVFGGEGQLPQLVPDQVWEAAQVRMREQSEHHLKSKAETIADGYLSTVMTVADAPDVQQIGAGFCFLDLSVKPTRHTLYHNAGSTDGCCRKVVRYACRCRFFPAEQQCTFGARKADRINAAVDLYLAELTRDPGTLARIRSDLTVARPSGDLTRVAIEQEITKLSRKETRLADLYADGDLTRDQYTTKRDDSRAERARLTADLLRLDSAPAAPSEQQLTDLAAGWLYCTDWDHSAKRAWLRRYCESVQVTRDGVDSVVLRLPTDGGGVVRYTAAGARTWDDLAPRVRAWVSAGDVAARCGETADTLTRLTRRGILTEPTGRDSSGRRVYTHAEADRIAPLLAEWRIAQNAKKASKQQRG